MLKTDQYNIIWHMLSGISRQKHLMFDIILVLMMMRKLVMSNYRKTNFILMVATIHETEIKQFGNRNGRNRVEIISTLGHKSRIVETDYEGQNKLRGSNEL